MDGAAHDTPEQSPTTSIFGQCDGVAWQSTPSTDSLTVPLSRVHASCSPT